MKEINSLFLDQFKFIMSRKKRSNEEVFDCMEKLWEIDRIEATRLAFITLAYARKNVLYKQFGKKNTIVDVMGLRNPNEGIAMVWWIMKYHPKVFYSNLYQLGVMFGGWKELIAIWEFDLKVAELDVNRSCISQCKMFDILMKAILDQNYGPEAVKAMPNIRRNRISNTPHRKCRNIIGKYIRSRMPRPNGQTQTKYYKILKRAYRGVKVRYQRFDMEWMRGVDHKDNYRTIMGQKALKLLNLKHLKNEDGDKN